MHSATSNILSARNANVENASFFDGNLLQPLRSNSEVFLLYSFLSSVKTVCLDFLLAGCTMQEFHHCMCHLFIQFNLDITRPTPTFGSNKSRNVLLIFFCIVKRNLKLLGYLCCGKFIFCKKNQFSSRGTFYVFRHNPTKTIKLDHQDLYLKFGQRFDSQFVRGLLVHNGSC